MEKSKVRVRFAPSPTGPLHMGGVRTALYNYLFAKQNGGTFILRIEDTDSTRFVPGAEDYIIEALKWCGINPDEGLDKDGHIVQSSDNNNPYGPYRQSLRKDIYKKYADKLIENGHAYYAFDSSEDLNRRREEAEAHKYTFTYNYITRKELNNSLTLSPDKTKELLETTTNWTIRFKNPEDKMIKMHDIIRGDIEMNSNTLDDKVLWKRNDELPTYHLANIVDDHLMKISHVIRGEEWLPSLPLHYMLYDAFGWTDSQPEFAHLSLLLKPTGKGKLSKRDGDKMGFPIFPLEWKAPTGEISHGYREDGYFPEAFVNIIALLGWNPGTEQEIFSLKELIDVFSLERVVKAGARFNPEKAHWFNQEYLRMKDDKTLAKEFMEMLKVKPFDNSTNEDGAKDLINNSRINDLEYITKAISLNKDRATFVKDFYNLTDFFFYAPIEYSAKTVKKFWKNEIPSHIEEIKDVIKNIETFDVETVSKTIHDYIETHEWPFGKVMNSLRLALVGASKGPDMVEILVLLGKDESIMRIERALANIKPRQTLPQS
ncbi:MAG: glutamate--tRNA ligase [Bacteroidales bacterium]